MGVGVGGGGLEDLAESLKKLEEMSLGVGNGGNNSNSNGNGGGGKRGKKGKNEEGGAKNMNVAANEFVPLMPPIFAPPHREGGSGGSGEGGEFVRSWLSSDWEPEKPRRKAPEPEVGLRRVLGLWFWRLWGLGI